MFEQLEYQLLAAATLAAVLVFLRSLDEDDSARIGSRLRVAIVLLAACWSAAYLLQVYSLSLEWKLFWSAAKYPLISLAVVAWLIFSVRACGFRRVASPFWASVLLVVPMAIQPLIWTNDRHGWFWRESGLIGAESWIWLETLNGPAFWVFYTYVFAMALFGVVCMLLVIASNNELSRAKRVTLALALLLPLLANVGFVITLAPLPRFSLLPFATLLSAIAIAVAFSNDLFERVLVDFDRLYDGNQYWLALRAARANTFFWDDRVGAYVVDDRQLNLFGERRDRVFLSYSQILGYIHPDDVEAVDAAYRSARFWDEFVEISARVTDDRGRERHLQLQVRFDRDSRGRVTRISGLLLDVSDRRRAEAALLAEKQHAEALNVSLQREIEAHRQTEIKLQNQERQLETLVERRTRRLDESNARIQLLMDSTAEAIIGFNQAGVCEFCNRASLELLGCEGDAELLGTAGRDLPFHLTSERQTVSGDGLNLESAIRDGAPVHVKEAMLWRHDGRSTPVELWIRPTRRDGELAGAVVTFLDISDRIEAESATREVAAKAAAYLEVSTAAIILLDCEGRIGLMNDSACRLLDCEANEMMGADWFRTFVPSNHLPAARRKFAARIAGEPEEDGEELEQLRTRKGDIRYVRRQVTELRDSSGHVDGFVYSIEDRTGLRDVESQLEQAQKLKSLGQLTGGIAHDFNNLLQVIYGNAQLLEIETESGKSQIEAIMNASSRGADLVQRLLAFARRQRLSPQRIEVGDIVRDMVELLRGAFPKNIEIVCNLDGPAAVAKADPAQVENALLNLAVNARDAMPGGGILTISCRKVTVDDPDIEGFRDARKGDFAELLVTDTGHGISEKALKHIFEPFFTTKEIGEGSGLGLSTVYGFAVQSGGFVKAVSEFGAGTSIGFYLPAIEADAVRLSESLAVARAAG